MITVPRSQMPQVDEKDIARLLVFLGRTGVGISAGESLPSVFEYHQDIDWDKARNMKDSVADKPVLVTKKFEIIDGNHRWAYHALHETFVPYIKLDMSFVEALDLFNVFPFAYELQSLTPERN